MTIKFDTEGKEVLTGEGLRDFQKKIKLRSENFEEKSSEREFLDAVVTATNNTKRLVNGNLESVMKNNISADAEHLFPLVKEIRQTFETSAEIGTLQPAKG